MSKIKCPYCKAENCIDYSEGDGTQEGEIYSQHCKECEKEFDYDTSISYYHNVFCKEEEDHNWLITEKEKWVAYECKNCDQTKTTYRNKKE